MKWHIVRYFNRVRTVCNNENNLQGQKIHLFIETLTSSLLKYKQDSSILSIPLEYKGFIKETVAFTKALHSDHSYYHTAFSLATHPPTEHMQTTSSICPKLAVQQQIASHSPSLLEESNNRLLLFLFSSCFIWMSLTVCVFLLYFFLLAPCNCMWCSVVAFLLGMFFFIKLCLFFFLFSQKKTSGLVAHESSTF